MGPKLFEVKSLGGKLGEKLGKKLGKSLGHWFRRPAAAFPEALTGLEILGNPSKLLNRNFQEDCRELLGNFQNGAKYFVGGVGKLDP